MTDDQFDTPPESPFDGRIDVPGGAHAEDEPDLEGYDDSQRAEVAEVEGGGQYDGVLLTDMDPDMGGANLEDGDDEDGDDDLDNVLDTDARP
ncbi:hypothetical protein [Sphingomonas sp.]|uniref:hypothetical protein n=1 Tax=Sphingomonas sp. TaxID=28214 RepID=UPI0025DEE3FF|nr:hypothetical protein [Sphingomonas sp.]